MKAWFGDRRRAQAGATLIELLVSVVIMGTALVLVIGLFSTGLLNATVAKRDSTAQAVMQYELDQISGSSYDPAAQSYSECFASENATEPTGRLALRGDCPDAGFSMRADVTVAAGPAPNLQEWSVAVVSWAALNEIGSPVAVYKDNR
ncbi:MAG: type II secretion system protein [Chloroflexi bacterium]|nr:MAG: type II secretion system protein [Chloroflexota bacterium]